MNARGFTLIELAAIIAVMAILVAFATPALMDARENARNKAVGRQVLSILREARSQAVAEGLPQRVIIDLDSASITRHNNEEIFLQPAPHLEAKQSVDDGWVDTGTFSVEFRPQGSCNDSLYVRAQQKDKLTIKIDPPSMGLARMD